MARNRLAWIVLGGLIVLLAVGTLALGGKKKSKSSSKVPQETARALAMPANVPRTVVVPPCNTAVEQTSRATARGEATPGATTVEIPRGSGVRFVLVPPCQPKAGVTASPGNIP